MTFAIDVGINPDWRFNVPSEPSERVKHRKTSILWTVIESFLWEKSNNTLISIRESNPRPLGWQPHMIIVIPTRRRLVESYLPSGDQYSRRPPITQFYEHSTAIVQLNQPFQCGVKLNHIPNLLRFTSKQFPSLTSQGTVEHSRRSLEQGPALTLKGWPPVRKINGHILFWRYF